MPVLLAPGQPGRIAIVPRWLRLRAWPALLLFILTGWPARLDATPLPGADPSLASDPGTRPAATGDVNGGEAPTEAKTTDGSPVAKATPDEPPGPPSRLIEFLDRQTHPHDWLYVSTSSSRHEVRVARIGPGGLSGVSARGGGAVPSEIAWRDIVRLERRESHFRAGQVIGVIVGAVVGGYRGAGRGESSGGSGAWSIGSGLVLGAAAGAWIGGAVGDGSAHGSPVYAVARDPVPAPTAATADKLRGAVGDSSAHGRPVRAAAPDPVPAPAAATIDRLRRLSARDVLRVRGSFGEFSGRVAMVQTSGLTGLSADPRLDRGDALPPEPLSWSQVTSIECLGNRSGRFAVFGSVLVAGLVGSLAAGVAASGIGLSYGGSDSDVLGAFVLGAGAGAVIGAGLGALAGSPFPAWHRVYRAAAPRRAGD